MVQFKLALLAKDNIILDTLLGSKPEMVELLLEPMYEETIFGSSAQSERKINIPQLRTFLNEPIHIWGNNRTPVNSKGRHTSAASRCLWPQTAHRLRSS